MKTAKKLPTPTRKFITAYMAEMSYADIEHDGEATSTSVAEAALAIHGDEYHLDDAPDSELWDWASEAVEIAYKRADRNKLTYRR